MSVINNIAGQYIAKSPLVAIMRGVTPGEVISYADVIAAAGWRCLEIPLNSPDALESIRLLAEYFGDELLIGAGTVLSVDEVKAVAGAGGRLVVAPNTDEDVIGAALANGMAVMPGFLTPTEAFRAYKAGARYLKLFPADTMGPVYIKAIRAVLPPDANIVPVGGVTPGTLAAFRQAGAAAYGIGSQLYKPGMAIKDVSANAEAFAAACEAAG